MPCLACTLHDEDSDSTEASSTTKWKACFYKSATTLVKSKQLEMSKVLFAEEPIFLFETTGLV